MLQWIPSCIHTFQIVGGVYSEHIPINGIAGPKGICIYIVLLHVVWPLFLRNLELQGADKHSFTKSIYNLEVKMSLFERTYKDFKTYSKEGKNTFHLVFLPRGWMQVIFSLSYLKIPFISLQGIFSSWYLSLSEELLEEFLELKVDSVAKGNVQKITLKVSQVEYLLIYPQISEQFSPVVVLFCWHTFEKEFLPLQLLARKT